MFSEKEDQLQNLVVLCNGNDPLTYDKEVKHEKWRKELDQEIHEIQKNDTWKLVNLPPGVKRIGVKWIYKTKCNEKGQVEKHNVRLMAKGQSQKYGINYNEVFSHVARWDTIRVVLALATCKNQQVY